MTVDEKTWVQKIANLNARRATTAPAKSKAGDYKNHLLKCHIGKSVLDVGCGDQYLKSCLPKGTEYTGIDPFPLVQPTMALAIEEAGIDMRFETVCAFAVLDGCRDFDRAIENMKRIATENIIFLTGIGIEIDKFHTFKLELSAFDSRFNGWTNSLREEVSKKCWLLEYRKLA